MKPVILKPMGGVGHDKETPLLIFNKMGLRITSKAQELTNLGVGNRYDVFQIDEGTIAFAKVSTGRFELPGNKCLQPVANALEAIGEPTSIGTKYLLEEIVGVTAEAMNQKAYRLTRVKK